MCTRSSRSLWRCAEAHLPTFPTQAEHQLAVAANLGLALQNSGRLDESLSVHDRVLRVLPTNADTHHNRGNALYQAARHAEAMASFDAAIHLVPTDAGARESKSQSFFSAAATPRPRHRCRFRSRW